MKGRFSILIFLLRVVVRRHLIHRKRSPFPSRGRQYLIRRKRFPLTPQFAIVVQYTSSVTCR